MFYVKVLRNMAKNWSLFAKSVTAHQVLLALENVDGFASMNFDVFFIKSFKDKAIFRSLNFYYPIFLHAKGTYAEVNTFKVKSPIYFNLIFSIQILNSQKDIFYVAYTWQNVAISPIMKSNIFNFQYLCETSYEHHHIVTLSLMFYFHELY